MQTIPASPQTKRQGGYTIIELGIALTIIAVLIVAGLTGVPVAQLLALSQPDGRGLHAAHLGCAGRGAHGDH